MRGRWWLRLLLRLYPEPFRSVHRDEIVEHVESSLDSGGAVASLRLAFDLARSAVRLRIDPVEAPHRGAGRWVGLGSDLRVTLRSLFKQPGFSVVVVATLALGIGLNAALFSVVHVAVLEPLPYENPEELLYLSADLPGQEIEDAHFSAGDLDDLRERSAFEAVEGVVLIRQNLRGAGVPRQVAVGWVSPGFLDLLGVDPSLGRLHTIDDPPGTVVLSAELWRSAFAEDADVLGRSIELDGHPYTIVGVMPDGFEAHLPWSGAGPPNIQLWKNPDPFWQNGDVWGAQGPQFALLQMVARLRDGATLTDAQAAADEVAASLRTRYAEFAEQRFGISIHPLHDRVIRETRPILLMLLGAVGAVLLIACANVAGLLLVRGHARRREIGLRVALGSSRARVGRLLLMESSLLAVAGTVAGLGLTVAAVSVVGAWAPSGVPRLDEVSLSRPVLGFAAALALLVTVLVGSAPVWASVRGDPGRSLGNARGTSAGGGAFRRVLVVGQLATSLVLLVGAGLLLNSVARLQSVEPGFDASEVYTFGVSIPGTQYGWPEEAGQFYRAVEEGVAALQGVEAAGVVWPMPFAGMWSGEVSADEGEPRLLGQLAYRLASEGYFPTAGIPLVEGRLFRDGDAQHVAVISRAVADKAWPDQSPIGQTVVASPWGDPQPFEVIGVVGDVRYENLREPSDGAVYFDVRSWSWVDWEVHVLARTDVAGAALVPSLRETVAAVDPEVPIAHPAPLMDGLRAQTEESRFVLAMLLVFAGSAGLLALVGLYGVISYAVGLRRKEFGVRVALGSGRSGIQRLVLQEGGRLVVLGLGLGLIGAAGASATLEALLFEVSSTDVWTYAAVAALLAAAALLASWVPAWRSGRVDPASVLRND